MKKLLMIALVAGGLMLAGNVQTARADGRCYGGGFNRPGFGPVYGGNFGRPIYGNPYYGGFNGGWNVPNRPSYHYGHHHHHNQFNGYINRPGFYLGFSTNRW